MCRGALAPGERVPAPASCMARAQLGTHCVPTGTVCRQCSLATRAAASGGVRMWLWMWVASATVHSHSTLPNRVLGWAWEQPWTHHSTPAGRWNRASSATWPGVRAPSTSCNTVHTRGAHRGGGGRCVATVTEPCCMWQTPWCPHHHTCLLARMTTGGRGREQHSNRSPSQTRALTACQVEFHKQ